VDCTEGKWKVKVVPERVPKSEGYNFLQHTDEYQITNESGIECIATMGTGWASGKALANAHLMAAAPKMYKWLDFFASRVSIMGVLRPDIQSKIRQVLVEAGGRSV